MKQKDFANLTNSEIVEYFRKAALERGRTGFNWRLGNRIFDYTILPAYEALAARGQDSLKARMSLAEDPNPYVRKDVATLAYNVDPVRCREALKELIDEPGWVGMMALVGLLHRDPEFSAEFDRKAKERYEAELARHSLSERIK